MISNTDSTFFIYSSGHIRVKAYLNGTQGHRESKLKLRSNNVEISSQGRREADSGNAHAAALSEPEFKSSATIARMWSWRLKPSLDGFPEGFRVQRIGVTAAIVISELP